mgnify:CR=1 FL=1
MEGEQKGCAACNTEKRLNGYMTLEMAMIFPAVFALVIMILYTAFFLYDKCRMTQDLYTAAYRQSILRGKSASSMEPDTSGYFMLKDCSYSLSTGSEICAECTGEIAPALVTGTGNAVFALKVTMKARKTDPPYSFRRFRRVTAIAGQALSKTE